MTPAERLDAIADGDLATFPGNYDPDAATPAARVATAQFLIGRAAHIRRYTPGLPLAEQLSRRAAVTEDLHLATLELRAAARADPGASEWLRISTAADAAEVWEAVADAEERHLKARVQATLDTLDGLKRLLHAEDA